MDCWKPCSLSDISAQNLYDTKERVLIAVLASFLGFSPPRAAACNAGTSSGPPALWAGPLPCLCSVLLVRADQHAAAERGPLVDASRCGVDDAANLDEVEATAPVMVVDGD
jgi:hypothetical protein